MKLFFVALWGWVACISGAFADSFIGDEFSANVDISTDSVVYENVMFRPGVVNVNDTLDFVNNGRVNTTFSVCDGCQIFIHNRGDFVADFSLGNNSRVIQVVAGAYEPVRSE